MELGGRLEEILQRRRARVPEIQSRIQLLEEVDAALARLRDASQAVQAPADTPALQSALARLREVEVAGGLDEARRALKALAARFGRDTINIGVSGRARVGKSTLLQSIAGLSDSEVPTGETRNVTAVRSKIFNAPDQRAFLTWHTEDSFLETEVRPYFQDLSIAPVPDSIEKFASFDLGAAQRRLEQETASQRLSEVKTALLKRLLMMQQALPQIRERLGGEQSELHDLRDLRRFVAYPTQDEATNGGSSTPRDYLAVRDCRIEAPFPVTSVASLGLVDLPGLGETASGFEDRILSGLRDEVDVVLLLKRAIPGLTNIDDTDLRALDMLRKAQGAITDTRDFTWVCINAGPQDAARAAELHRDLESTFNAGAVKYLSVDADATDARSVHDGVLEPVLTRLSERLDQIDAELIAAAEQEARRGVAQAALSVAAVVQALDEARSQTRSVRDELAFLAEELLKDLQGSLAAVDPDAIVAGSEEGYMQTVRQTHEKVCDALEDGLDHLAYRTRDEWLGNARRERDVAGGTLRKHAIDELNRLRVKVTDRYAALDEYMNEHAVRDLYADLLKAIGDGSAENNRAAGADRGALLKESAESDGPSERLTQLIRTLEATEPAVPNLVAALRRLSGLRFDFRLQSFPVLYQLNQQFRPRDGGPSENATSYPPDFESPERLYTWLFDEARRYSYLVHQALLNDAARQFDALRGAVLVLEDDVIRDHRAAREMHSIAEAFRDDLWPGRFDGANHIGVRLQHLAAAARDAGEAADRFTASSSPASGE